jgi:predicted RNA-binding Zn-ribbon protein involved in translation (DUF1610 family)
LTRDRRILDAWEQGQSLHPLHRALAMLAISRPDDNPGALAQWPIADRDRALLALREELFGGQFAAVTTCPACGETLDVDFALDAEPRRGADQDTQEPLRLPDTLDLLAVLPLPPDERLATLAERLVGRAVPAAEIENLDGRLTALDPLAEISLGFECPACGEGWQTVFDIAAYLWDELDDVAVRLMRETDLLARTYGWSEAQILAVPPHRRQVYLDFALEG